MPKSKKKIKDITLKVTKLKKKEVAFLFNVLPRAVYTWTKEGCPRSADLTYSLVDVIAWRESRLQITSKDEKSAEEIEKLKNQNIKLGLEIAEKRGEIISREDFIQIQQKQSSALLHYLTDGFKRNSHEMYARIKKVRSVQGFLEIFDDFIKQAMDKFIESGVNI